MPKTKVTKFPPAPKQEKDGSVTVYVLAETFTPDGVQYKPYAVHLRFTSPVAVPVNIPANQVISFDNGNLLLTDIGLYMISKKLATASSAVARTG